MYHELKLKDPPVTFWLNNPHFIALTSLSVLLWRRPLRIMAQSLQNSVASSPGGSALYLGADSWPRPPRHQLCSYWSRGGSAAAPRTHVQLRAFQDQDGSLRVSVLRGKRLIHVLHCSSSVPSSSSNTGNRLIQPCSQCLTRNSCERAFIWLFI